MKTKEETYQYNLDQRAHQVLQLVRAFPKFDLTQEPIKIGEGATSNVYQIEEEKVVKIWKDDFALLNIMLYQMIYESTMHKITQKKGVSVPKTYGIHQIDIPEEINEIGLVMDKAKGELFGNFDSPSLIKKIKEKSKQQIYKASRAGLRPFRDWEGGRNIFYDQRQDKVTLIDFGWWRHIELPSYYDVENLEGLLDFQEQAQRFL